jgi:hypothetical protein
MPESSQNRGWAEEETEKQDRMTVGTAERLYSVSGSWRDNMILPDKSVREEVKYDFFQSTGFVMDASVQFPE